MAWEDLLFAQWPVPPAELQAIVPGGLEVDTFDGSAWLGIVPFRMTGVRRRLMPPLPGLSAFPELNVRTYVVRDGKPGVWFFTLDATSPLAVRYARRFYHLPYCDAKMHVRRLPDGWIDYRSTRRNRRGAPVVFAARYRPAHGPDGADARAIACNPLANWLTARFCLYSADRQGGLYRGEIDHAPWPLEPAEVVIEENTLAASLGIELPPQPPLLHFSRRVETVAWSLERC